VSLRAVLRLELSSAYDIVLEPNLRTKFAAHIPETTVALISDSNVNQIYGDEVAASLVQAGKTVHRHVVLAGEASKSLATYGELVRALIRAGVDRRSAVIALGGGVVGDLAGFAAASLLRGMAFYQCPTSLLAMVDSSIGGKTGINLPEGKNLLGAFWQPNAVLVDVEVLRTLPAKTFREGAVELFKHGLLADEGLADAFRDSRFVPDGGSEYWLEQLPRAMQVKADIVSQDETERGVRAFLNLGHTLGHALEAHSHAHATAQSVPLSHGEAVAYGLVFAAKLSAQRGYADELQRVLEFLAWLKPKPLHASLTADNFEVLRGYLQKDKKVASQTLRWVLLEKIGQPLLADDVLEVELESAWRYLLKYGQGIPV
jgi:3-dehydroquinate synthase